MIVKVLKIGVVLHTEDLSFSICSTVLTLINKFLSKHVKYLVTFPLAFFSFICKVKPKRKKISNEFSTSTEFSISRHVVPHLHLILFVYLSM